MDIEATGPLRSEPPHESIFFQGYREFTTMSVPRPCTRCKKGPDFGRTAWCHACDGVVVPVVHREGKPCPACGRNDDPLKCSVCGSFSLTVKGELRA